MEIERPPEAVICRGLLPRKKASKIYENRCIVTSSVYKREAVMLY